MHHLMDLGCGYKGRVCVGVPSFPEIKDIFCNTSPSFRGRRDGNKIYFNNFQNIPTAFQGIIRNTPYIELGTFEHKNTNCVLSYDPLNKEGLFDAFSQIATKAEFIAQYGNYNSALQCYASDSIQTPGVLTPSAELNDFAAVPLQAVPTAATASVDIPLIITIATQAAIEATATAVDTADMAAALAAITAQKTSDLASASACSGFKITVKKRGRGIRINVKGGDVYTQTTKDGAPVKITVKDAQINADEKYARVYLILQYKATTDTWVGKIQAQQGTYQDTIDTNHKQILLGTVYYSGGSAKIQQTKCSPVDARLGTDIVKASRSSDEQTQVLTWGSGSYAKKWMLIKDCG